MKAYKSVCSFVIFSSHSPFHCSHLRQIDLSAFYPCCVQILPLLTEILQFNWWLFCHIFACLFSAAAAAAEATAAAVSSQPTATNVLKSRLYIIAVCTHCRSATSRARQIQAASAMPQKTEKSLILWRCEPHLVYWHQHSPEVLTGQQKRENFIQTHTTSSYLSESLQHLCGLILLALLGHQHHFLDHADTALVRRRWRPSAAQPVP